MYNALAHSLEKFTKNTDEINFVILMSDGLDGFKVPTSEIENSCKIFVLPKCLFLLKYLKGSFIDGYWCV